MRFLRFQVIFGHVVSHCQCSKIYPKLPKFAQRWKFEIPPKIKILVFFKNKICMCRGGTRACLHCLDFQSKNFSYAIFIVKNWPLYVNFSIPLCAKWCFFQGSIPLMDMRFCWYVPNSPRNKNLKSLNPYLLYKMVFLAPKNSAVPLERRGKTFFFNFEPYDLANGMEWVCKIWWTYKHTS
jgi:hypothetical protein